MPAVCRQLSPSEQKPGPANKSGEVAAFSFLLLEVQMLGEPISFRASDEHRAMLAKLTRAHRRSRADVIRLLIEREANRIATLPDRAGLTVLERPEVLS